MDMVTGHLTAGDAALVTLEPKEGREKKNWGEGGVVMVPARSLMDEEM